MVNATSLGNKFDELELISKIDNFDLIFITETWFNELNMMKLEGYESFNYVRKNKGGGGVNINIKSQLSIIEIEDEILCNQNIEQIWCGIKTKSEKILIGCFYRPPAQNDYDRKIIDSLCRSNKLVKNSNYSGILICGDFYCPKIDWHSGLFSSTSLNEDDFENNLLDCSDDCFYHQHVIEPTFQLVNQCPKSILDLVITS